MDAMLRRLLARMQTYEDLVGVLSDGSLTSALPVPSNTIGEQLWCVVGARESYARAIEAGAWAGFSCSLTADETQRREPILSALESSASTVRTAVTAVGEWTERREEFVLDLLEHEAQHQGQLIRYVYGLGYEFPESWKRRWALT